MFVSVCFLLKFIVLFLAHDFDVLMLAKTSEFLVSERNDDFTICCAKHGADRTYKPLRLQTICGWCAGHILLFLIFAASQTAPHSRDNFQ